MPSIAKHQAAQTTKLLLIGAPGAGKTGALCSLAAAGYNVRVLDMDNGLDVVRNLLLDPKSPYPKEAADHFHFITVTENMKKSGTKLIPQARAWGRALGLLNEWKDPVDETINYGHISTWTTQEVLVIDSLSMLCNAAMAFVLSLNGRLGQQPHQSDWGAAQNMVESLLQMLYDEEIKCNVVVSAHIVYIGEDNGPQRGYPSSLGKALSPKIGRYFNTALMVEASGQGAGVKQKIYTKTRGIVDLKNTNPLNVAPEYSLEWGLSEYFKAVRGEPK